MLSANTLKRLSQLNRKSLPPLTNKPVACDVANVENAPPSRLEISAGRELENACGRHWVVEQPLDRLWPSCGRYLQEAEQRLKQPVIPEKKTHPEITAFGSAYAESVLLLDLETCGFAGSMVFLVGLIYADANGLKLSQLLARNYAEEKAVLQTFWSLASRLDVLVTYNGKSFDWPMIHDRSTLYHLGHRDDPQPRRSLADAHSPSSGQITECPQPLTRCDVRPRLVHFDLLHHARRRWGHQLPNCKLQTLERSLCGRHRVGDIPGREIPDAYHDYVRTGQDDQLRQIMHHNALDLVTLLQVALLIV